MIQINSWSFSNMFSYGDNNKFTTSKGVTQLLGVNGEGKSSIATILEELLYNKNSRGIKKSEIVNRYSGKKGYSGEVNFYVNGVEYMLVKEVTTSTKLTLFENGVDISGHTPTQTYKKLEQEILGMDFTTFTKLSYQSMSSSLDFLTATDANRKKFLISLLGLEEYAETEKALKEATKESKRVLDETTGRLSMLSKWIKEVSEIPETIEEVHVPEVDPTSAEEELTIAASIMAIEEKNKTITSNNRVRSRLQQLNIPEDPGSVDTSVAELELADLKTSKSVARHVETTAISEYRKVCAIKETCPACGGSLGIDNKEEMLRVAASTKANAHAEYVKYESKVSAAEIEVTTLLDKAAKHSEFIRVNNEAESLKLVLSDTIPETLLVSKELERNLAAVRALIADTSLAITKATKINLLAIKNNSKAEHMHAQLNKFNLELTSIEGTLEGSQNTVSRLTLLTKAFGSKGLIAYKIESMVKEFETLINQYLLVLSSGKFSLSFEVQDSKLVLNTYAGEHSVDIRSLSSGEFNRVNTATLLAIRKVMTSLCKTDLNLLILDEVISVLDMEGKETLIDVLRSEPQMSSVVVSHGYEHPLTEKVLVSKTNNISRIK